jgi:hypothetical protein
MTKKNLIAAALVAGAFALPAYAAGTAADHALMAQAGAASGVGGADPDASSVPNQQGGNGSGSVGSSRGAAGGASFRSLDANGDGYVSRAEAAAAGYTSRFDAMDTDRDGRLSEREYGAGMSSSGGSSSAEPRDPNPGTIGGRSPVPGATGTNPNAPQR